jgi:hypothetical protein
METAIIAIVFLMLSINPAMAIRWWFLYDFEDKRNQRWAKYLQTFNAITTIALMVLLVTLFDKLACGYNINW